MDIQEFIKIIAAISAFVCIIVGIIYMRKDIKSYSEIDLSGIVKGKIKTGSAGVLLVFCGTVIFLTLIIRGSNISISDESNNRSIRIDRNLNMNLNQ